MEDVLLVKYGEIILKGKNRKAIEDGLIKNIAFNLKKVGDYKIYKEQGRFLIKTLDSFFDYERVTPLVCNTIGVNAVCKAIMFFDTNIENIKKLALEYMQKRYNTNISFKVEVKRSDKNYPLDSRQIAANVGGYILENMQNITVDVHNPDIILNIELRNNVYIYTEIEKGFGGLPILGDSKATVLLSGGIDSPVAAFMMAKRGVNIEAIYFDSPPYTSIRAKQKVIDIAEKLATFAGSIKLYIVPFTNIQLKTYENVPKEKLTIILKRTMLKIAEKIAIKSGSLALVTGDSIGQVASQTMQAIDCANSAVNELTILRPLCGMDKQEIIDIARKIGTYDISIRPYEDCCTIFVAKHPQTKPKKYIIEKIEQNIKDIDKEIEDTLQNIEIINI